MFYTLAEARFLLAERKKALNTATEPALKRFYANEVNRAQARVTNYTRFNSGRVPLRTPLGKLPSGRYEQL